MCRKPAGSCVDEDVTDPEHEPEDVAAWLRRGRPVPDDAFVDRLEHQLVGVPARGRRGWRVYVAGLAASSALAGVVVAATLVGGGPFGSHGDDAKAREDCVTVTVRTVEQRGQLVERDGQPRVVTVEQPVSREVTRCR